MKIKRTKIPIDSVVNKYENINYSDSYVCEIPSDKGVTPDEVLIAFWTNPPEWVVSLFKLRNFLVQLVGLKNDDSDPSKLTECILEGKSFGILSVPDKTENETVMKLSDKHLDAYISVFIASDGQASKKLYISTLVEMNNLLGYLYFYPICPFHHLVVKGTLKHILK